MSEEKKDYGKTLNLPSSLNSVQGKTFNQIYQLETINFQNGNNTYMIEDGYLYSKDGKTLIYVVPTKTTINVRETVETIGTYAIHGPRVTELIIPDNVTTISTQLFNNTYNLKKIEIGRGVKKLDSRFKSWSSIPNGLELTIDSNNPYYKVEGNLILTKDGKEVVTFINNVQSQIVPNGVEKLQGYAFITITAIEIILPSTLREIGTESFAQNSYITKIEIPSSVKSIGSNAFDRCSNLAEIRINKTEGSISGSPWGVPKGERAIIWLR